MPNTNIAQHHQPKIGEVYMVYFEGSNNEQNGLRPGLVVQNNTGNMHSPNIIVLPLTSQIKKSNQPTHVIINSNNSGLEKDSMVLCENPKCMSKIKLGKYLTTLSNEYMMKIAEAYILASSIIAFLPPEHLSSIWSKASTLNSCAGV